MHVSNPCPISVFIAGPSIEISAVMNQPPYSPENILLRTMAHALRHAPESHFLEMDENGWVELDQFLLAMRFAHSRSCGITEETIRHLAGFGDAARFEIDNHRIRALYGHSRAAPLIAHANEPPVFLYHGTSAASLSAIVVVGLRPMRRRQVHLSSNWCYANSIAQGKQGTPVVLIVGAYSARQAGVCFHRATGHVWLADEVPPKFITVPSPGQSGWGRDSSCESAFPSGDPDSP